MKKIITLLALAIAFIACKKPSTEPKITTPNTAPPVKIFGAVNYNQYLLYDALGGVATSSLGFNCKFFEAGISEVAINTASASNVGSVYVNNKLTRRTNTNTYIDSGFVYASFPLTYSISGAGSFSTTSFTDSGIGFASTNNFSSFPNTISKSAGLSYTLTNFSNVSSGTFYIGTTSFSVSNNVISITPSQLSSLSSTLTTSISLVLLSNNPTNLNFSQKNYSFNHGVTYVKQGISVTQ